MTDPYRVLNFSQFITALNQGEALDHLTIGVQRCAQSVRDMAADKMAKGKATLTITLEFTAEPNKPEKIHTVMRTARKLPTMPAESDVMFIDDDGNLTLLDPGHETLFPGSLMGRRRPAATAAAADSTPSEATETD